VTSDHRVGGSSPSGCKLLKENVLSSTKTGKKIAKRRLHPHSILTFCVQVGPFGKGCILVFILTFSRPRSVGSASTSGSRGVYNRLYPTLNDENRTHPRNRGRSRPGYAMNLPTVSLIATCALQFGTVVIGSVTVYIAHQQRLTNQNQLRLHLFDKRFDVYKAVMTLATVIMVKDITGEEVHEFEVATRSALFLFGKDGKEIQDYCDKLRIGAINLQADQYMKRESERVKWFSEQYEEIPKRFASFLMVSG
jgi:hypothetical protein